MTLFFHAINRNGSSLSFLFSTNLAEQCTGNCTTNIEKDMKSPFESDFIVISRIFGKALFVKSN